MNTDSLKRVFGYMFRYYKWHFFLVVLCIIMSAVCTLQSTLFTRTLIDDYITPLLSEPNPDFSPLAARLAGLTMILAVGVVTAYAYNRIMVTVGQGTMEKLRVELFTHMESLPIKYFDTHAHGDIMSTYTNDVDTLRQLIGQSIPQAVSSLITILTTFVSMIILDIPLTLISVFMIGVMLAVSAKLGGKSKDYFVSQQKDLGAVNGYIEEMLKGQKVVKVFNHEKSSVKGFEVLNDKLRDSANNANKYANIMMPVMANLGNISYVLCAVVGAGIALSGSFGLTLGTLVSFLSLNRSFTMPVTQISQQIASLSAPRPVPSGCLR